jgi:hypothetical protein
VQPVGQFATEAFKRIGAHGDLGETGGAGLHGRSIAASQPGVDKILRTRRQDVVGGRSARKEYQYLPRAAG